MKLIWHIIKKDIRRERWALVLWVLLFAVQIAFGISVLRRDTMPGMYELDYLRMGGGALVFLQGVFGYLLVSRLVQADGPLGAGSFWMTRPIATWRMFAAKGLGALLLFGLLPVLLLLPWWLYCHFGAHALLWTAVETLGWQLLVIAPAFLIASLTSHSGRVLLGTLGTVLAVMALYMIVPLLSISPAAWGAKGNGIMLSRYWLSAVLLLGGGRGHLLPSVSDPALVEIAHAVRHVVRADRYGAGLGALGCGENHRPVAAEGFTRGFRRIRRRHQT